MDQSILNENGTDTARSGLLRLHDAVGRREAGRPETALSPEELLLRFRGADPTRNAACLPWLLRTYAAEGYRLEDLSKVYDTLAAFARLRGQLPNTATIDGETRNPRKLGSHTTLASLWSVIAPFVEAERMAQEGCSGEQLDTDRGRALTQSRVLHRSNRMVVAVPMTEEASCWWGEGTQWCTAARKNNAFDEYHKKAPLIVICLRKVRDLPARKLQLHVHASDIQFMDENDARVSPEIILERWQDLEALVHWAVGRNGEALGLVPEPLRTEAICTVAVATTGRALEYVPWPLCTEAICTVAVATTGRALEFVPEPLRTEAICTVAVGGNGRALEFVPAPLRTEAICTVAVMQDARALKYVPEHLRTEAICTVAVGRNGEALQYVPEHLRTEAICSTAVTQNARAFTYVPQPLRTEEMCLDAVGRDGLALQYVTDPLRTEAVHLIAVDGNGWALRYVPESLCTEAICSAAVGNDGMALRYVPENLRTKALCLTAVTKNRFAINHVPGYLRVEITRLATEAQDKQKSEYVNDETNERESHDLVLEGMEDYLNNSQPNHQNTSSVTNIVMHQ